ncbi:MAG: Hsp20/alpha crystallin family protein [Cyanothece sp. SIO1E1]|nr:Hsp20/alpha crystallin family protein [Cyanothece sp. SIO1E1]
MTIAHQNPFQEPDGWQFWQGVGNLQQGISHLLGQSLSSQNGHHARVAFEPLIEMQETPDAIYLKLEIPGLETKELNVQATENMVSVSGDRKFPVKPERADRLHSEFHYGKFERVIPLPTQVRKHKVQAEYVNGVLSLTLPIS